MNLGQFDKEFKPGAGSGLESLADGDYECVIEEAKLIELKDNSGAILKTKCTILSGPADGHQFRQEWWINSADKAGMLGADLKKLGFDTDQWKGDRAFSVEIEKAVKLMEGLKMKFSKKANEGKKGTENEGRTFHNLRVIGRGQDGQPAAFGPKELDAAVADAFS